MEAIVLSGSVRTQFGKEASRKYRAEGRTPAVLYGHGIENSVPLSLDPKALTRALANPKGVNALFTIEVDGGETYEALVREMQREPVSRQILHIDLIVPNQEKPLTCSVPVTIVGRSPGVALGGVLRMPYSEVKLLVKPRNIPESIEVDVTELDIGDSVMASELSLPDEAKLVFERDFVVIRVSMPRGLAEGEELEDEEGGEGAEAAEGGDDAKAPEGGGDEASE